MILHSVNDGKREILSWYYPQFIDSVFCRLSKLLHSFTSERLSLSKVLFLYPVMLLSHCNMSFQLFHLSTTYFSSLLLPLSQLIWGCICLCESISYLFSHFTLITNIKCPFLGLLPSTGHHRFTFWTVFESTISSFKLNAGIYVVWASDDSPATCEVCLFLYKNIPDLFLVS